MYKKILVPLDGSKRAERILPHVEELASHYRAKVILLTALDYTFAVGVEGSFSEFSEQEKDFNARTKDAQSYLKGISKKFSKKDIDNQRVVASGPAPSYYRISQCWEGAHAAPFPLTDGSLQNQVSGDEQSLESQ